MEMTADAVPQTEQEENKWMSYEERAKLVEEYEAFLSAGGLLDDFAASHGVSKWVIMRWRKKYGRTNKRKVNKEKFQEANALVASGLTVAAAVRKVGMTDVSYYYYLHKAEGKPRKRMKSPAKMYAPRKVKEMPVMTEDRHNKSLVARIMSLEKLVVELSLDRQALIEVREGAI